MHPPTHSSLLAHPAFCAAGSAVLEAVQPARQTSAQPLSCISPCLCSWPPLGRAFSGVGSANGGDQPFSVRLPRCQPLRAWPRSGFPPAYESVSVHDRTRSFHQRSSRSTNIPTASYTAASGFRLRAGFPCKKRQGLVVAIVSKNFSVRPLPFFYSDVREIKELESVGVRDRSRAWDCSELL